MHHQGNIKGLAFMEALLKPYNSWEDFPAALRDTFRTFRDPAQGRELIIEQNAMIEQVLPGSVRRRLSEQEMHYYREPFSEPSSRRPIWEFIQELPIGGSPAATARLVADYSDRLKRSNLPKLLIYANPGAITTAAEVAWCYDNLQHFQAVNIGPGIHFHQEDNPDAVGRELASWYRHINSIERAR
jgi:haloalkane dehalogenase